MVPTDAFTTPFFRFLAESFGVADTPDGYMLDTGHSGFLGTINALRAAHASTSPTTEQATLAAHCTHVLVLLQFFAAAERGETPTPDRTASWQTGVVADAAWQTLRQALQTTDDAVVA